MKPIITVNEYPIGWEWLDKVPLEDFTWLIEINRKGLAYFMNEDQGYKPGISMYGHYIACKSLNISSEEEYMNQLTDIRLICNEL
nr:MAG: hypothetical protein [Bacteriophage sp.]